MKLGWRAILGIGITVLLLWWLLRNEDLGELSRAIVSADFMLLGAAVAVATSGFLVRAFRWKVLLHPLRPDTKLRSRWAATNIGFMANNLLPARVGEFARAFALSRLEPVTASGAFGTLAVERFLDGVTIFSLLLVAVFSPGFPSDVEIRGVPIGSVVNGVALMVGVVLVALFLLIALPRKVIAIAERITHRLPGDASRHVVDALEAFLQGLTVVQSPRLLALALLWSFGLWLWQSFAFWLGFLAYDIHLSYSAALFVNAMVALAVAVPSSPGFFGTFHAGAAVGLQEVFGVAPGPTLAFAFGFHFGGFVPVTLIGLYYSWRLGMSLSEVEKSEAVVEEEVERDSGSRRESGS